MLLKTTDIAEEVYQLHPTILQTFLTLSKAAGRPGAFFTYAAVALVGMAYFFVFLPETKGISLERTDELFRNRNTFIGFQPLQQNDGEEEEGS